MQLVIILLLTLSANFLFSSEKQNSNQIVCLTKNELDARLQEYRVIKLGIYEKYSFVLPVNKSQVPVLIGCEGIAQLVESTIQENSINTMNDMFRSYVYNNLVCNSKKERLKCVGDIMKKITDIQSDKKTPSSKELALEEIAEIEAKVFPAIARAIQVLELVNQENTDLPKILGRFDFYKKALTVRRQVALRRSQSISQSPVITIAPTAELSGEQKAQLLEEPMKQYNKRTLTPVKKPPASVVIKKQNETEQKTNSEFANNQPDPLLPSQSSSGDTDSFEKLPESDQQKEIDQAIASLQDILLKRFTTINDSFNKINEYHQAVNKNYNQLSTVIGVCVGMALVSAVLNVFFLYKFVVSRP